MNIHSPIPHRISDYFVTVEDRGEIAVRGTLKCSCGCEQFALKYFGKKGSIFSPDIVKDRYDGEKRLVLVAQCKDCGKEILVYDSITDGYDGDADAPAFDGPLEQFFCKGCGDQDFSLQIAYNSSGREALLEEGVENWQDKFSMILCSSSCRHCGKEYKGFVEQG